MVFKATRTKARVKKLRHFNITAFVRLDDNTQLMEMFGVRAMTVKGAIKKARSDLNSSFARKSKVKLISVEAEPTRS